MRVVIFGGNGFIGKHLVELLKKQKKIEIKFLDKLRSPSLPALSILKLIKKIGKIKFEDNKEITYLISNNNKIKKKGIKLKKFSNNLNFFYK